MQIFIFNYNNINRRGNNNISFKNLLEREARHLNYTYVYVCNIRGYVCECAVSIILDVFL